MTVFTRTWNAGYESSPANTQAASQGAQRIRELKLDVRERLAVDHIFGDGSANEGYHNIVHLAEQGSDPSGVANYGVLYTKEISTITELFYRDSAGTITQITQNGNILGRIVGEIVAVAITGTPAGYLPCDGAAVSRTTYASLFAAIGTTWGAGNGSTTFNVPNLARRTLVGKGGSGTGTLGNAVGNTGGSETNSHTHDITHTHSPGTLAGSFTDSATAGAGGGVWARSGMTTNVTISSGTTSSPSTSNSGAPSNTNVMQPSAVIGFFIKF